MSNISKLKLLKRVLLVITSILILGILVGLGIVSALDDSPMTEGTITYAEINPTGCGIHKNKAKLRLDFFLTPAAPNYDKHHVYVVDEASEEYQEGYSGEVDSEGSPLDLEDYQKWLDSLPHIWRDNPFHTHFIYPNKDASDADIKTEIEKCLNYFYAFHQYCWNEGKSFIEEWKKVPTQTEQVRCPFIKGKPEELEVNEAKVQDILSRVEEFQVDVVEILPQDLRIGERGTVDVGSPAIDRSDVVFLYFFDYTTQVEGANPANAEGIIDTVEAWFSIANAGNSVKYGTFEDLGSNELKCHDAEEYGEVSSGSKQTCTGLSIDISTGEYIGADARAAVYLYLESDTSGGTGVWYINGQYCDPNDQGTFSWNANYILSLYGTGTEAEVGYPHSFGTIIG